MPAHAPARVPQRSEDLFERGSVCGHAPRGKKGDIAQGLLEGKCGIITGVGSGMGQVMAVIFARHGAKVLLAARRVEKLEETRKMVEEAGGEAVVFGVDIADEDQVKAMVATLPGRVGREGELDGALLYLASDAGTYTTGQMLCADGGPTSQVADLTAIRAVSRSRLRSMTKRQGGRCMSVRRQERCQAHVSGGRKRSS